MEFMGFCSRSLTAERVEEIIKDPARAPLQDDLGDLYALIAYVAAGAKRDDVSSAAGRLLQRLKPELSVVLTRQVLRIRPDFSGNPGFVEFVARHRSLLG